MPLPIDPSMTVGGPEWNVGSVGQVQPPDPAAGQSGFGGMLSNAISSLDHSQTQAAGAAQSLVDGPSKDLLLRGFKFVGSTICYAMMQAVGMVNDHLLGCFRYQTIARGKARRQKLSE